MNRSLEIIMFDANRQFGNQMILPIGPLREPMSRLATADFVIQNGLSKYTSENYYHVKVVAINFVNLKTGKVLPLESFENIDVIAVAAIGNTQRFFTTLREFCHIKTQQTFSDHHSFVASDFDCFENDIVIMTEKDAVKCQSFSKNNWYYLQISMTFENELTEKLTQTILAITSENKPPFLL